MYFSVTDRLDVRMVLSLASVDVEAGNGSRSDLGLERDRSVYVASSVLVAFFRDDVLLDRVSFVESVEDVFLRHLSALSVGEQHLLSGESKGATRGR